MMSETERGWEHTFSHNLKSIIIIDEVSVRQDTRVLQQKGSRKVIFNAAMRVMNMYGLRMAIISISVSVPIGL